MSKLGRPLVVAAFVGSLVFLGLAMAVVTGGPNWPALADDLDDYSVRPTPDGKFAVQNRVTQNPVGTRDSLPDAVLAAYRDAQTRSAARLRELNDEVTRYDAAIVDVNAVNEADRRALEKRLADLRTASVTLSRQLVDVTNQGSQAARTAGQRRTAAAARAAEVARLQAELDALRADLFQIETQQDRLRDEELRLRGGIDRAARRRERLAG